MSYPKFADMIETSSLYFCRLDVFQDKLEGTQPDGSMYFAINTQNPWQIQERMVADLYLKLYRNMTFVNCWHINENENFEMWKNYSLHNENRGVAIQTTFGDLVQSIADERKITDLKIKYVDFQTYNLSYFMANPHNFFRFKDLPYSYESELRLITFEDTYPEINEDKLLTEEIDLPNSHIGERISVDLNVLIKSIYLPPNCTEDFSCSVNNLLVNTKLNQLVKKSEL